MKYLKIMGQEVISAVKNGRYDFLRHLLNYSNKYLLKTAVCLNHHAQNRTNVQNLTFETLLEQFWAQEMLLLCII